MWVDIAIHRKKYVYNGLSEVSPKGILVTGSAVAGVDFK